MNKLTLEEIVKGIRRKDNGVIGIIYKDVFPKVRYYIVSHGGKEEDAKDVFQEAIIVIYKQIKDSELNIKLSFESYLFGIARLLWLKLQRQRIIHERNVELIDTSELITHPAEEIIETDLQDFLYRKYFAELGKECQNILQLSIDGIDNESISQKLGYKSEKVIRNLKYKCKEALISMIKGDPLFKRIAKRSNNSDSDQ